MILRISPSMQKDELKAQAPKEVLKSPSDWWPRFFASGTPRGSFLLEVWSSVSAGLGVAAPPEFCKRE